MPLEVYALSDASRSHIRPALMKSPHCLNDSFPRGISDRFNHNSRNTFFNVRVLDRHFVGSNFEVFM